MTKRKNRRFRFNNRYAIDYCILSSPKSIGWYIFVTQNKRLLLHSAYPGRVHRRKVLPKTRFLIIFYHESRRRGNACAAVVITCPVINSIALIDCSSRRENYGNTEFKFVIFCDLCRVPLTAGPVQFIDFRDRLFHIPTDTFCRSGD